MPAAHGALHVQMWGNSMKQFGIRDQIAFDTFSPFHPATLYTYCGHALAKPVPVIAVAWSPDGQRIASAGNEVRVWNAFTGCHRLTYHLPGWLRGNAFDGVRANAVAWSPGGSCLAVAGCDGKVRVLQVE